MTENQEIGIENDGKDEILIYQTEDGQNKVEITFVNGDFWMSTNKMAKSIRKPEQQSLVILKISLKTANSIRMM